MLPLALRAYHEQTEPDTISPYVVAVAAGIFILLAIDNIFCRRTAVDRKFRLLLGYGDLALAAGFLLILQDEINYALTCLGAGAIIIVAANMIDIIMWKKTAGK